MKRSHDLEPIRQARRAQTLVVDMLGGGDGWHCQRMPALIRGGAKADCSDTYVFASSTISEQHVQAMCDLAISEGLDVVGVEYGSFAGDLVQITAALRRGRIILFAHHRLWMWPPARPAIVSLEPLVSEHISLAGNGCRIVHDAPWRDEDARGQGLTAGDRLARRTIWSR